MDILSRIERTVAQERKKAVLMNVKEDKKRKKQRMVGQLWNMLKADVPEHVRFIRKHLIWYRSHFSVREHLLADLYCPQANLVVLLGQAPVLSLNDEIRDARLREAGYRVLRINLKEENTAERWTDRIKEILQQAGVGTEPSQLSFDFSNS